MTAQTNDSKFATAKWIVSANISDGATHTTIAAAITAASTGDTIFIKPGTYTENITVGKGLTFAAYTPEMRNSPNVTITGKITVSSNSLSVLFFGIKFTTNGDNSFALTGNASEITCQDCYFNAADANSISATGDGSTNFYIENCSGNIANTRTIFTTTNASIWIKNSLFIDFAGTPATSTSSSGGIHVMNSVLYFPLTTSSSGQIHIQGSRFGTFDSSINTTWITTAGTGSNNIQGCQLFSGTASAISVGAGTNVYVTQTHIFSTNTAAIAGAGSVLFTDLSFSSSSNITTTTKTVLNTGPSTTIGSTNSGATNALIVTNASDTANSQASIAASVAGTSAGDPFYQSIVTGATTWTWGADNSDSDAFAISANATLGTTNIMRASTAGEINYPLQPAFLAVLSSEQSNVTGNNVLYTVVCNTEIFDQNGDYNNATGIFTAPVTGRYQLNWNCATGPASVDDAYIEAQIVLSNRELRGSDLLENGSVFYNNDLSVLGDMDAADTATFKIICGVGTQTVDVKAQPYTHVSGYLAC